MGQVLENHLPDSHASWRLLLRVGNVFEDDVYPLEVDGYPAIHRKRLYILPLNCL